jgi:hypothetical protein
MAHYVSIFRPRDVVDPGDVEALYARVTKDWTAWKPEDGLTMQSLWCSLDGSAAYGTWETDDPNLIAQFAARFSPVGTFEIIPVISAEENVTNWVKTGLIPADIVQP